MGTAVVELISEMRRASGVRLREAGEHLGVSESTLSRYENGHVTPPDGALAQLERFYRVKLAHSYKKFVEQQPAEVGGAE